MKFETYVHKIVLDHQPNFHKDPCKDAHARDENTHFIHFCQSGQNIMSPLKRNIQIPPSLSTN